MAETIVIIMVVIFIIGLGIAVKEASEHAQKNN